MDDSVVSSEIVSELSLVSPDVARDDSKNAFNEVIDEKDDDSINSTKEKSKIKIEEEIGNQTPKLFKFNLPTSNINIRDAGKPRRLVDIL